MKRWFAEARFIRPPGRPLYRTLAACFGAVVATFGSGVAAQEPAGQWELASQAVQRVHLSDLHGAASRIDAMEADAGETTASLYARAQLEFHRGNYDQALELVNASITNGATFQGVTDLRDLLTQTIEVVGPMATYTTPSGLFEIRYDASRDEVVLPWAAETLEAAYYEIGYDLGYWPEPPIRIELLPRAELLARTSSLSEEAIQTSGTIALCKYNKLLVTSPRGTARGYGWRDTISHEYVHYVVSHMVHRDLPIWLHEALAKYLEGRWRGHRRMTMDPSREDLLTRRVAADNLVTFEQMHPSMAYLPSAEDASTAYAEVFTITEFLVGRRGVGSIREWLIRVRDGAELEAAFEATFGETFGGFERSWMSWLRERPPVDVPGDFEDEVELVGMSPADGSGEGELDDEGLGSVEARDHVRLGELLRARSMLAAAIVEYRRAELLVGTANPRLQGALAQALLQTDDAAGALAAVEDVRRWYPTYYPTHLRAAEALVALQRPEEALAALDMAVSINPFDPAVHDAFARAWDLTGDAPLADRARRFASIVR
jgi:tetratricopeptide (TPR) repeat protein